MKIPKMILIINAIFLISLILIDDATMKILLATFLGASILIFIFTALATVYVWGWRNWWTKYTNVLKFVEIEVLTKKIKRISKD